MMQKAIVVSILVATVGLPVWAARDRSPVRGLKKTVFYLAMFNLFYLFAIRVLYPRL